MPIMIESELARVVDALLAARESNDALRLETAVHQASVELKKFSPNSSLERELQELLLSVVESLGCLLDAGITADPGYQRQLEACDSLLRHAKAVAAMMIDPEP